ncbi:MAG TPA: penicillin-binding protein 2 [Bacteroidetes bacterium]|nr:penicillin-binding protein 2 [Candidatus Limimorpha avicola]
MIRKNPNYSSRQYVVIGIFSIITTILLARLFYIQIISQDYKKDNTVRHITLYPSRGRIIDRNGKVLVYNDAIYDLMVVPRAVKKIDTVSFCNLLNIDKDTYINELKKARRYSSFKPSVFISQLTKEEYGKIAAVLYKYPGFYFQIRSIRSYNYPIAAHTVGNIGEVSRQDLENDSYYSIGDFIGKSGIESYYEKELRGKKGVRLIVVDVHNREKESFMDGRYDTLPVAGKDIILGLDADLQKYGEYLMNNKSGSIVAIEPSTGEVLAMISAPTYNPTDLVGRKRSDSYQRLLDDSLRPLINRAVNGTYPPGSTFKTINALIGLQSKAVNTTTKYICNGPESSPIKCTHYHHSPVGLIDGLENSCNPYFWNVYQDMLNSYRFKNVKQGYQFWYDLVLQFGLGTSFKTDIASNSSGNIPDTNYFNKLYRGVWNAMTVRSLSIGQGELLVTPLQLANMAAAIGNEGFYYPPHYIKRFEDGSMNDSIYHKVTIDIDKAYFKNVKEGMRNVFEGNRGTARFYRIDSITVAGKTGTAENPHGLDHSIIMAFAPIDNPRIAIAVIVENAGFGSSWAAPIASLMIEKYIKGYVTRPEIEERVVKFEDIK